jgi:hypothetical protein
MEKKLPLKLLAFIILGLLLANCGNEVEFENHLIGTWKYINYQTDDWEKIIFDGNKSYELQNYTASSLQTVKYSGSYTYTDTTFSLRQYNTTSICTFLYAIETERLYVYHGKTYTKQ